MSRLLLRLGIVVHAPWIGGEDRGQESEEKDKGPHFKRAREFQLIHLEGECAKLLCLWDLLMIRATAPS